MATHAGLLAQPSGTPILKDSSERALALATTINCHMTGTRTEESYQDLALVVAAHRKKYDLTSKKHLKKLKQI